MDGGLRSAYVEAGPADGPVVVLLHGEPTWSFLYRRVMRMLADAGIRAIDKTRALALPGVHAVFSHADLPESMRQQTVPLLVPAPANDTVKPFGWWSRLVGIL